MTTETISVSTTVNAPPAAVFAILADPGRHAAIDGTGWVRAPVDKEPLTHAGQIFRMAMYYNNPDYPDGHYEVANKVENFDEPRAISWKPGQQAAGTDEVEYGGWIWRYDLTPVTAAETEVKLSYDWSAVPPYIRERIEFPPFAVSHLENSLRHLAELAVRARHSNPR